MVLSKIKQLSNSKGIWANGCVYHGYTFFGAYNSAKYRIPSGSLNSIDYTFTQWKQNPSDLYM